MIQAFQLVANGQFIVEAIVGLSIGIVGTAFVWRAWRICTSPNRL